MKLGCLNHARLTESILISHKLPLVGWIANQIDPQMECYQANITYLQNTLRVPLLANISHNGRIITTKDFTKVLQCH